MPKKDGSDFIAKKVVGWLNTKEGKKALQRAGKVKQKAGKIDRRSLHTPFGPADGSGVWPHQCN